MKTRKDDDQNTFLDFLSNDPNTIKSYKQIVPVSLHHFYIVDEIEDVKPYLDLINTLKTAEAHDTIFINLNTPGGNLNTAIQIMSAIKQSSATVITCLEGSVCSAGTLIFLSGHKFMVNPNCTFMIHNYSQWTGGKGNEIALQVKYQENYFHKLAKDVYGGFLTENEIKDVLQGKDLWFESDEVISRLKALNADAIESNGDESDEEPTPKPKAKKKKKIAKSG
jgi:ATP-dependent protease ClpP protease subunit